MYQKIAQTTNDEERKEVMGELEDRYGSIPSEVQRLFVISSLRGLCAQAGINELAIMGNNLRIAPVSLPDSRQARLKRLYPSARLKPAIRVLMIPLPQPKKIGEPSILEGENDKLLEWVEQVIRSIFIASIG